MCFKYLPFAEMVEPGQSITGHDHHMSLGIASVRGFQECYLFGYSRRMSQDAAVGAAGYADLLAANTCRQQCTCLARLRLPAPITGVDAAKIPKSIARVFVPAQNLQASPALDRHFKDH